MNDDLVISFFDCCKSEGKVFACEGKCSLFGENFRSAPVCYSFGECFSFAVSAVESAWRLAEKGWQDISAVCVRVGSAVGILKRRAVRTSHLPVMRSAFTGRRFLTRVGILRI
jgi:hypothetical protein